MYHFFVCLESCVCVKDLPVITHHDRKWSAQENLSVLFSADNFCTTTNWKIRPQSSIVLTRAMGSKACHDKTRVSCTKINHFHWFRRFLCGIFFSRLQTEIAFAFKLGFASYSEGIEPTLLGMSLITLEEVRTQISFPLLESRSCENFGLVHFFNCLVRKVVVEQIGFVWSTFFFSTKVKKWAINSPKFSQLRLYRSGKTDPGAPPTVVRPIPRKAGSISSLYGSKTWRPNDVWLQPQK